MPRGECPWWCSLLCLLATCAAGAVLVLAALAWFFWAVTTRIQESIALQSALLSRITPSTPISGLYGPGTWCAWLITLGMSTGHTLADLVTRGRLSSGWDYDLLGASFYTATAAIDLIVKSRTIAALGPGASESVLLPALVCAERVVSLGSAFSVVSLVFTFRSLASDSANSRMAVTLAGTALVPLVLGLIASFFSLRAHEAILRTIPVLWCSIHNGPPQIRELFVFTLPDWPAWLLVSPSEIYLSSNYWVPMGMSSVVFTTIALLVAIVASIRQQSSPSAIFLWPLTTSILSLAVFSGIAVFVSLFVVVMFGGASLLAWVLLYPFFYLTAFVPQLSFFPPTGSSILEMDQIAAVLGVAGVAAIRSVRLCWKVRRATVLSEENDVDSERVALLRLSSEDV